MAGGVTTTGFEAYDRAVRSLPGVLAAHLERAARTSARRLQTTAQAAASARDWQLANEIFLEHIPSDHRFRVFVRPRPPRPANLPLWLVYGTRHMTPRDFWTPAVERERAQYPRDVDRACQAAYDETVNR